MRTDEDILKTKTPTAPDLRCKKKKRKKEKETRKRKEKFGGFHYNLLQGKRCRVSVRNISFSPSK